MNRIQLFAEEPFVSSPPKPRIEQAIVRPAARPGQHCSLFAPLHYERNYAYPLLVWLHGPNDDERQLQRVMPLVSMRNYVGAGPRGTCQANGQGYTWGDSDEHFLSAEQRVFDSIQAATRKYHIASDRIFLGGFNVGGTMAFQIGLRHPDRFAGVLSLGGPFPLERMPLLRLDEVRSLPLFIAQGRDAEQYPVERTCEELRLFHAAGLSVTLRQYPCGDDLYTQMLHDTDVWMMELVTGVSATDDTSDVLGDWN
jgi:phospholipase/carboxylesterase